MIINKIKKNVGLIDDNGFANIKQSLFVFK